MYLYINIHVDSQIAKVVITQKSVAGKKTKQPFLSFYLQMIFGFFHQKHASSIRKETLGHDSKIAQNSINFNINRIKKINIDNMVYN